MCEISHIGRPYPSVRCLIPPYVSESPNRRQVVLKYGVYASGATPLNEFKKPEKMDKSEPQQDESQGVENPAAETVQNEVTVYYLEMLSPRQHQPKPLPEDLTVVEAQIRQASVNRFLYQFVGAPWNWLDKLSWSDEQWCEYAENPNLRTWIAYNRGSISGYFELQQQAESTIELKYFGLAPKAIGKGFGGALLSCAIESAWQWGDTRRVWVNTCTLDHQHALANYQSRGFEVFKRETIVD